MSFKRYTIYKRKKKTSTFFFRPFFKKKKLGYDVVFSDSVKNIYPYDDGPVNKLFGLSFGIFDICAPYFGWALNSDFIDIYACVQDGDLLIKNKLLSIKTNLSYCLQIRCYDDSFTFSVFDSDNTILCYQRIRNHHSKNIGRENFIELHKHSTVFRNVDFYLQRKV